MNNEQIELVARALCAETCAYAGEPPCYSVEGDWPNSECDEPGCHTLAARAIAAMRPDASLIDLIGELGREVFYLMEDCETSGPPGEELHAITEDAYTKVSAILDRIDELPYEEPGVILGTGAKLQAALKGPRAAMQPDAQAIRNAALREILVRLDDLTGHDMGMSARDERCVNAEVRAAIALLNKENTDD